jgi:LmbE family N-acetylglucosaminyl deacetylase
VAEVLAVLEETQPHLVVTFGPEGITGHADHISIGAAATEAFHVARASGLRGAFARLLHLAVPETGLERLNELLRGRGLEPLDPSQPYVPRGVSDETIGVTVDCSDAYGRKLEALRCHKTQGEMEDIPFDLWHEILGTETFVLAWPERAPNDPVLSDVLEGLAGP